MGNPSLGLEVHSWEGQGYKPLVFSHDWQVALMNWEPAYELKNAGQIERHKHTDEVFILTRGHALMIAIRDDDMQVVDMQPGVVYNIAQGVWHNVISSRDATWIIVENRDTHLHDNEFRRLSEQEMALLQAGLPNWLK